MSSFRSLTAVALFTSGLLAPLSAQAGTTTCSRYPCSATIGSRGGTLTVTGAFNLVVPAGALRSNATFTVSQVSTTPYLYGGIALSSVVQLTSSATSFALPVYVERYDYTNTGIPDLWHSRAILDPLGWMPSPLFISIIVDPNGWIPTPEEQRTIIDPGGWLPPWGDYSRSGWAGGEIYDLNEPYFVVATPR